MILNEAFSFDDMIPKASRPCSLFLGRMQPIHNGHAKIIKSMTNGVVAIVKGAVSSTDKKRNPLSFEYQRDLVKKIAPSAKILAVPTGFIPEIVNILRQQGKEVDVVYAGADRIAGYKAQIDRANKVLEPDKQISVKFKETERVTSATVVRDAIRSDDEKSFQSNVPKAIWGEFSTLKSLLKESEDMSIEGIKSFEEFLEEQSNVTDGVETKDVKVGKVKRRVEDDELEEEIEDDEEEEEEEEEDDE